MKPLASTKVKGRQITVMALKSGDREMLTLAGAPTGTGERRGMSTWAGRQADDLPPPACVKQAMVMMSPQPAGLRGITDTLYGVSISAEKSGDTHCRS